MICPSHSPSARSLPLGKCEFEPLSLWELAVAIIGNSRVGLKYLELRAKWVRQGKRKPHR
jgi:hypothetical protein